MGGNKYRNWARVMQERQGRGAKKSPIATLQNPLRDGEIGCPFLSCSWTLRRSLQYTQFRSEQ